MKQLYLTIIMLLTAAITINAAPRSKRQITDVATQVLNSPTSGIRLAPRQERITELQSNNAVTVMGYPSGGYAIIANDDRIPAVLGYSDTKFDTTNPGFKWYLDAVSKSAKDASAGLKEISTIPPDTNLYDSVVSSFVKTKWHQGDPYNRMTPLQRYLQKHAMTGCVATALAQIFYYNRYPAHLDGTEEICSTFGSSENGTKLNLNDSYFEYDSMLTDYSGLYTKYQADAVAKLMLDCGVAIGSGYGLNETGATTLAVVYYFTKESHCYPNFTYYERKSDLESQWMNIAYGELSKRHAILYLGGNASRGRHAFVLDGYQNDGKVHINWGWGGSNDGYYDLANIDFTIDQEMITGFYPPATNAINNIRQDIPHSSSSGKVYNLQGQEVGDSYKGIVIINGRKVIRR